MIELIEQTRAEGDSLGGVIECVIRGVAPGLGEPVFDKLEADLAKAMLSLPATKGFEIGSGFRGDEDERLGAQRPIRNAGGESAHNNESFRRRAGRDQQRRRHRFSRRVQTDRHDRARAANGHRFTGRNHARARADDTTRACCRGPCRWSKRWRRWSCVITLCGSARSGMSEILDCSHDKIAKDHPN